MRPQARAITTGSPSVIVGLFDSGVDITHPDLAGRVKASASASCLGGIANPAQEIWSNDVLGHGTFTSGLVGAAKNNVGIVGVAPNVTLAMVKVAVDDFNDPNVGQVFADAFVCAVDWAIGHNWDLINASLTIDPFTAPDDDTFCSDQPDRAAIVKIVRRAILEAARNKITMVAATGNAFTDLANLDEIVGGTNCQQMPVQLPRVIGVSAVGVTQKLAFYSNYGFGAVDLTAPGGDGLIPNPLVTDTTASGQVLGPLPPESFYYQQAAGLRRPDPGLLDPELPDVRVRAGDVGGGAARDRRRRAGDQPLRQDDARTAAREDEPGGEPAALSAQPLRSAAGGPRRRPARGRRSTTTSTAPARSTRWRRESA